MEKRNFTWTIFKVPFGRNLANKLHIFYNMTDVAINSKNIYLINGQRAFFFFVLLLYASYLFIITTNSDQYDWSSYEFIYNNDFGWLADSYTSLIFLWLMKFSISMGFSYIDFRYLFVFIISIISLMIFSKMDYKSLRLHGISLLFIFLVITFFRFTVVIREGLAFAFFLLWIAISYKDRKFTFYRLLSMRNIPLFLSMASHNAGTMAGLPIILYLISRMIKTVILRRLFILFLVFTSIFILGYLLHSGIDIEHAILFGFGDNLQNQVTDFSEFKIAYGVSLFIMALSLYAVSYKDHNYSDTKFAFNFFLSIFLFVATANFLSIFVGYNVLSGGFQRFYHYLLCSLLFFLAYRVSFKKLSPFILYVGLYTIVTLLR